MSRIKKQLLNETKLTDKPTLRASITYGAIVDAILDLDEKKVTDENISKLAKTLRITETTMKKYIEAAKKAKILNKDGSVAAKYAKKSSSNKLARGKLSTSLNKKAKKFIAPKVTNNNLFAERVFKMLSHMQAQAASNGAKNPLMLTGDPGTGKTSFIRNFAKLLGLPLVVVEAPHITEEHIINIPFMIIKGNKVRKDSATVEITGNLDNKTSSFDIVQAESNLVTELKSMKNKKLRGQQYLALIAKDKNLRGIFMNVKKLIEEVRKSYNCILFLDEYYRNDNIKIRNILRNILNGRIGNDKIPKGTYIVYASNLDDDGLEDIPMNNDFIELEFKAPDKEQWFDYLLKKYEENEDERYKHIDLKPEVFNKFYEILKQEDLSYDDPDADVRTSPRRWEQLLLFINANLPVANVEEAKILMSNVELNFRNYIEGSISNLYPKVQKAVVELIKETSGIEFDGSTINQTEWKDVLEQQLATKITLDSNSKNIDDEVRKYVPVVAGEPGIGKTAHMSSVADKLDLHFIHIDVATLTRESTTGIPKAVQAVDENGNPKFDQNGNPVMTVEFSKPELLDLIEKKMQEAIEEDSIFPEEQRKKGQGKYKFLLLFDELSRADAQVFNAIRKLLLEKSFNEQYNLPEEILVVGALNPEDEGVNELTKHTRDVLDIIPARASWSKTESYLLSAERPEGLEEALGFDCNTATVNAVKIILTQYQSREEDWRGNPVADEERLFNLMEGGNIIYLSPREITDIVTMTNTNILNRLTKIGIVSRLSKKVDETITEISDDEFIEMMISEEDETNTSKIERGIFDKNERYSEEDFDVFIDAMIAELRDVWANKLSFVCKKQEIQPDNFLSVTTKFIMSNKQIRDQYEVIKTLKIETAKTIQEIFEAYYDNPEALYQSTHFDNYLTANLVAPQKFVQEITDFLADKIVEIEQSNISGEEEYETVIGKILTRPKIIGKKQEVYMKFLKYMYVILKILTNKIKYEVKEQEIKRTGQYIGNLYILLKQVGNQFLSNYLKEIDLKNAEKLFYKESKEINIKIKKLLKEFGILK